MRPPPKLIEASRYPVTAGIALLAVGVTVAWWMKVDINPLVADASIRRGELWRLLTSMLPHGGVLHLVFNVYWLWVFGTLIEDTYGHFRTALMMVVFGMGSSAWEFALAQGGIGLSGVGYGLFGLLWMLSRHDERFREAIDPSTVRLFIGWFFFCIVATWLKVMPVANIAHGVGAILGILTGIGISNSDRRAPAVAALGAVIVAGIWGSTAGRPKVNLSQSGGYEEARWGYEALVANNNREALRWFQDAVMYQPKSASFWYDLGLARLRTGDNAGGLAAFRRSAELGESTAQLQIASFYENGTLGLPKDEAQALEWYRRAADAGNAEAANNLAWAYATSPNPAIRNPAAALTYARKAVDLGKDDPDPNHLDTLAEAFYVNGQYQDAVKTEEQAVALAPAERKQEFEKRLAKYREFAKKSPPGTVQ